MKEYAAVFLTVSLAFCMFVFGVITGRSMDCPRCEEPKVEVCYLEIPDAKDG